MSGSILLVEHLNAAQGNIITESVNSGKDVYLSGIMMQADIQNRNGRIYPLNEMKAAVDNMNKAIKEYGADIIVGHHQHLIQSCDTKDDYLKIFCLGNFINDQFIEGDGYYFDSPLYNAVFHLSLDKKEDGTIEAKKSFSIYTTVKNMDGLSCVIDAYDVYKKKSEPYLGRTILRAANLFAGKKRYTEIKERYEL